MTGRYQAYPEYKKSGIEWLGDVPSHWISSNLKLYCNVTDGSHHSPKIQNDGYPFISVTDVGENEIDFENCKRIADDDYYRLVKEGCKPEVGNVLLTKDGTIGRATIVKDSDPDFVILSSLGLLSPSHKLSNRYLYYFLVSGINVDQMNSMIHGSALKRMTINKIDSLRIVFPEITEQQNIADFLDYETAKIDKLITKQEKLIELLKEKRQAVISHAVTKGLDPDVEMKDSGVEWLGEVPNHWNVMQFRRLTSLSQGLQIPQSERFYEYTKSRAEYITIKSINAGNNATFREYIETSNTRVFCTKDEILLARTGATGEVITNVEGVFHNNFFKITFNSNKIDRMFLFNLLKSKELKSHLLMLAGTTTIPDLNHGAFLSTSIALPKMEEQGEINRFIESKSKTYEMIMNRAYKLIDLMKVRKTALISAAVTGKIDVRNWQG